MSLEGTVVNGRIELEGPVTLPEGARVRVELVAPTPATEPPTEGAPVSPLAGRLLALAGRAIGLPPDMARNHDHYIHGAPKR